MSNTSRYLGAAASGLAHVLLLLLLLDATSRATKLPPKPADIAREHTAQHVYGAGLVPVNLQDGTGMHLGQECPDRHYTGIGVLTSSAEDRIIDIGPNTPAERAGLKRGDAILNPEVFQTDNYPPGAILHLRIRRDDGELEVRVVPAKICND